MSKVGSIVVTVLATLVVLVGTLALLAHSGALPVAASGEPLPFVESFLETARESGIHEGVEQLPEPPFALDDAEAIATGLRHFHTMCVTCHGAPGVEAGEIGKGLHPRPPALHEEEEEAGEVFWVTKHGIRMTGMPSFGATHGDRELWAIAAFVGQLPTLSAAEYASRVERAGLSLASGHGHGGDGHHGGAGETATAEPTGGDGHAHAPGEGHG